VERHFPSFAPGQGARLFLRMHALLVGLWQLTDHPAPIAGALASAGLGAFGMEFATELEEVLRLLLRGMEVP
jgi:hypothetical protein